MSFRVAIGVPTNRGVKPQTALSLMRMVANTDCKFKFIVSTRGYNTAENRNLIVAQAVKANCDYLLLTDDDMVYEPEYLTKLINHDKDIIGGIANTKYEEQKPVVEYLDQPEEGLFKCKALGGGFLLIKTDVFKKVDQPHFGYKWFENGMVQMSNDWFFCEKARKAGYDIWADSSLKLGHIGEYAY